MSEYVLVSQGIECNRSNNPYDIISEAISSNKEYNKYLERCAEEYERPADNEMFVYKEERNDTTEVDLFEMSLIIESAKTELLDKVLERVKEHHYLLRDQINSTDYGMFTVGIEQVIAELKEEVSENANEP